MDHQSRHVRRAVLPPRGLGFNSVARFKDCPLKMKRKMVAEHCKREEAHKRKVELLTLARNSDFVKWDLNMTLNRDWTNQIFGMSPALLAFTLNGQANTLPSPSKRRRWGFHSSTHHCILCGKLGTTAKHTESNCPVALKDGRFTMETQQHPTHPVPRSHGPGQHRESFYAEVTTVQPLPILHTRGCQPSRPKKSTCHDQHTRLG